MGATAQNQETVTLLDGTSEPIRRIRPSDAAALQRFHRRLSVRSVYQRFFGALPALSEGQARYFTRVDGVGRVALVALDPGQPEEIIAVVRFDRDPGTDRAEYAAVVADRWQGGGLGLAMTRRLIAAARARGVRSLYALVLPDNLRMLNPLLDLGLPERVRDERGVERVEVDLCPRRRARRPDRAGSRRPCTAPNWWPGCSDPRRTPGGPRPSSWSRPTSPGSSWPGTGSSR